MHIETKWISLMFLCGAAAIAVPTPAHAQEDSSADDSVATEASATSGEDAAEPSESPSESPQDAWSPSSPSASLAEAAAPETPATSEGPRTSFSVRLNQDIFFGFYTTAAGTVELLPGISLSLYTILWTTPSFSSGADPSGFGLWTEFGGGVAFSLLDDRLTLTPQVGILNGVLLSGASQGVLFEGIVPNFTAQYRDSLFEAEIYFGYYIALREQRANDFIHYWVNAGVRATSFLSVGAHWEHLVHSRGGAPGSENLYQWLGLYVGLNVAQASLRFSAGLDLVDTDNLAEFYKVTIGMDL